MLLLTRPEGSKDGVFQGVKFVDGVAKIPNHLAEKAKVLKKYYAAKIEVISEGDEDIDETVAEAAGESIADEDAADETGEGFQE